MWLHKELQLFKTYLYYVFYWVPGNHDSYINISVFTQEDKGKYNDKFLGKIKIRNENNGYIVETLVIASSESVKGIIHCNSFSHSVNKSSWRSSTWELQQTMAETLNCALCFPWKENCNCYGPRGKRIPQNRKWR